MRKRGLARAELISWWPEIVGETYAASTAPERIRWPRDGTAATLFVRCDPAFALQFTHETDSVRERINRYFGYAAIGLVRIVQRPIGPEARPSVAVPDPATLPAGTEARLASIDDPLRDSLRMLGRSVLARP
jgi:hypothetical protein